MHHIIWKPISFCTAIVMDKKSRKRAVVEPKKSSQVLKEARESRLREALEKASVDGYLAKLPELDDDEPDEAMAVLFQRSRSLARLQAQKEFLKATSQVAETVFSSEHSIPELDEAYDKFKRMYPKYSGSCKVDEVRYDEYCHLEECYNPEKRVCLDYCGFGLFSYLQQFQSWESSAFGLSEISVNLCNHALYGAPDQGTAEHDIRQRIMEYLNIQESEYSLVLTVSRGSAFKLLAESYPFHQNRRLLTMYDYESESVNWMIQGAREKGAKTLSASFKWPTLKLCSTDLRKQIEKRRKRRKDSAVGLFAFPVQSRVTGTKYSYQWMSMAQQNNWHVLLDAGSLGPKDMDSLGLSLFRPDFIITSFYKVFGLDPTGFGCLFIKRTMMTKLYLKEGAAASGVVKIVPVFPNFLGDSLDFDGMIAEEDEEDDSETEEEAVEEDKDGEKCQGLAPNGEVVDGLLNVRSAMPAFSGAFSMAQGKDFLSKDSENMHNSDGASTIFEEVESISGREVMRSPVFSEDDTDHSLCIDLGRSPMAFDNSSGLSRGQLGIPTSMQISKQRLLNGTEGSGSWRKSAEQSHDSTVSCSKNGRIVSFDAAALSFSEELASPNTVDERTAEDLRAVNGLGESKSFLINGGSGHDTRKENARVEIEDKTITMDLSTLNKKPTEISVVLGNHEAESGPGPSQNGGSLMKENAIRRETEGEFRLLGGRRGTGLLQNSRFAGVVDDDIISTIARRVSFENEGDGAELFYLQSESESERLAKEDVCSGERERSGKSNWGRREPEIVCRHLDHVDMMGLNKTTSRHRYLTNWLVVSLLQLHFKGPNGRGINLVRIYGPKIKFDRGAAVAFNLFHPDGTLIDPELVQRLADRNDISLGLAFLSHLRFMETHRSMRERRFSNDSYLCKPIVNGVKNDSKKKKKKASLRIEVLTVSLGFLSNFEDVFRLWAFVAKFLNPNYVQAEQSKQPSQSGTSQHQEEG